MFGMIPLFSSGILLLPAFDPFGLCGGGYVNVALTCHCGVHALMDVC